MNKATTLTLKRARRPQVLTRMIAADGILNMHERAAAAGLDCKLNGECRKFRMDIIDCGTAACLHGSAALNPWFLERGYPSWDPVTSHWDKECEPLFKVFWGSAAEKMRLVCALRDPAGMVIMNGPYAGLGKRVMDLTISDVRVALRNLILEYGGAEAIALCDARKAQGDAIGYGIPKQKPAQVQS